MELLGKSDIEEVCGGFCCAPFLWGTVIGLGTYVVNKVTHQELMSYKGAAVSAGFGAFAGGMGGLAAEAAGGGLVGNAVWRPGMVAVNAAGQAIARDK